MHLYSCMLAKETFLFLKKRRDEFKHAKLYWALPPLFRGFTSQLCVERKSLGMRLPMYSCLITHLVQRLSACSGDVLDHNVAVDEIGTDPRGVEDCSWLVEEHNTHHVVANVSLLVYLSWGRGRRKSFSQG